MKKSVMEIKEENIINLSFLLEGDIKQFDQDCWFLPVEVWHSLLAVINTHSPVTSLNYGMVISVLML